MKPPTEDEIKLLADRVANELKQSDNDTLRLLGELISEKRNEKEELLNLLKKVMEKLSLEFTDKTAEAERKRRIERQHELKKKYQSSVDTETDTQVEM